jgi:type IV secretory pathway TraG/TraD family ATPase VirD4
MLRGKPSEALLDPISEKTAQSIRTNIIAFVDWLKIISSTSNGYSTREWIQGTREAKTGWLFISCPRDMSTEFQPIFASIFELTLLRIMRLGEDKNRRIWLIMDELPANGKIPSLATAASQIRKYGGCIVSGLQLLNQLIEIYGYHVAKTIVSQFSTKVIFRTDDIETAKIISQLAGQKETKETSESQSYGSHEMRDSVSINQQHRVRQVIQASDIAKLGDLEVYVKLPAPGLQFAKINLPYIHEKNKNEAFIERPLTSQKLVNNTSEELKTSKDLFIKEALDGSV